MTLTNSENSATLPAYLAKYPTPFHLYYENRLAEDASALERGLRESLPNLALYYSTKTNALLPILRFLLAQGWGLEVVGPADAKAAALAGAAGDRLLLGGGAWSRDQIEHALFQQKIARLTIDSLSMAKLLGEILQSNSKKVALDIAFRLHDGNSHFGFPLDQETLREAWAFFPNESVRSLGLHLHSNPEGSIRSLEALCADFRLRSQKIIQGAKCLEQISSGRKVSFVDLGGGIDSPAVYRPRPEELAAFHHPRETAMFQRHVSRTFSLLEAGRALGKTVSAELKGKPWEVSFEPGRSVCTRALSTVLEVRSVKHGLYPGAEVVLTDGNTSLLGPLHRGVYPVSLVSRNARETFPTFVYGNLPHSGDWLFQSAALPKLETGDRLMISHTGAYFLPLEANFGYPKPAIYSAGKDLVIRVPESDLDPILRDTI
jgi:diaminopimelate decarboxylase